MSTALRIFKLAVHLVRGELARGPKAFWNLVRETARTIRGDTGSSEHAAHPTVVAAEQAEEAAPEATGVVARVATKFGLGLLRQGWVEEASWLLGVARRRSPDSPSLAVAHDRVEGEVVVLRGEWRPPEHAVTVPEPVPGRVLHIVGKSLPHTQAGYTIRTQSIAEAQRAADVDVHVVTRPGFPQEVGGEPTGDVEYVAGVPYHRLTGSHLIRWDHRLDAAFRAVAGVVESVAPSLLHAHSDFENAVVARAVGDAYGLPVVYEIRGFWEETWLSKYPGRSRDAARYRLRREREVAAAMAADRVVTLTAAMKDRLGGDGVDPATIDLVPNAVDPDLFPLVERNNALAESLGIRRDETTVGYISSLVGYEGVDVLIDACAQLLEMGHRVRCVVVGDGDDRARLEKHAADRGVASEVVFTGRVDRSLIADHYGLIDIFVVPRLPLPVTEIVTPLKPYEALSTGRVLVMSDVGALRPIAEASAAAELFEAGDPAALAAVLARLIQDPERRRRLAADGAAWVRAERTWQANGDRYRKLYADMGVL